MTNGTWAAAYQRQPRSPRHGQHQVGLQIERGRHRQTGGCTLQSCCCSFSLAAAAAAVAGCLATAVDDDGVPIRRRLLGKSITRALQHHIRVVVQTVL